MGRYRFAVLLVSLLIFAGWFSGTTPAVGAFLDKVLSFDLNANGHKITTLGTPTATGDATPKSYVDAKTWNVANGGTGNTSATAYGLLAGGTTSTSAFQSLGLGTAGQILQSAGSGALPTWQTRVLEITTPGAGTWTNPRTLSGNTFTRVVIQQTGAGGAGGGGRLSVAGTAGTGGGGGGGGAFVEWECALANLPDTVPYSVGGGGLGGGPGFSATGTAGTAGGSTTFGDTSGAIYYEALGGLGGAGGTTTSAAGAAARSSVSQIRSHTFNTCAGGSGNTVTVSQGTYTITTIAGPTGGGGGAGSGSGSAAAAGSRSGRYAQTSVIKVATEGGSAAGGAIATNGQAGSAATSGFTHWDGCGGGGGGGASAGLTAGNGGTGYRGGGGGGGGGASGVGANAGSGGNGGDGVLKFTYYLKRDLPTQRSRLDYYTLAF